MSWARSSLLGLVLAFGAPGSLKAFGAEGDEHEGPPKKAAFGAEGDEHEGPPKKASAGSGLRSVRVGTSEVAAVRAEPLPRCAEQVRAELLAGQRRNEACGQDREAVGRALVRRRDAFGFVEQREVDLASLRLVLGEARRCRQWPLRSPERDVLRRTDVAAAGCRLRRYQGEVSVELIDREGRRREPLPAMRTDRDGRVELRFAELDRALRVLGEGTLDGYARIELGDDGWAGHVDLEQLLRFRADWHLTWLLQGRGTAGLFAVRHPEHPGADDARTLAAEARLERQARDYERVEAGKLSPRAFLDRHPRSPYERRVESLLRSRATATRSAGAQPEGAAGEAGRGVGEASAGSAARGEGEASAGEAGEGEASSGEAGRGMREGAGVSASAGKEDSGATSGAAGARPSLPGGGRRGGTTGGGGP